MKIVDKLFNRNFTKPKFSFKTNPGIIDRKKGRGPWVLIPCLTKILKQFLSKFCFQDHTSNEISHNKKHRLPLYVPLANCNALRFCRVTQFSRAWLFCNAATWWASRSHVDLWKSIDKRIQLNVCFCSVGYVYDKVNQCLDSYRIMIQFATPLLSDTNVLKCTTTPCFAKGKVLLPNESFPW